MLRRSVALALVVWSLVVGVALGGPTSRAGAAPASPAPAAALNTATDGYCADGEEQAFLAIINDYRGRNGLAPLTLTQTLGAGAEHHSVDMAELNYFSHTLADGTDFSQNMINHGYGHATLRGENIAAGYADAARTFELWRTSPGHNSNMLRSGFAAIGIGRAYGEGSRYGWYWTTVFGGVADGDAARCGDQLTLAPVPAPEGALSGTTAITTTDLNLRAGPSLADAVFLVMPPGAAVTLTGQSTNGFVSVSFDGTPGWAFAAYLRSEDAPAPPPTPTPDFYPGGTTTATSDLNLRAGPGTGHPILAVMPYGAMVTLTGESLDGFLTVHFNGLDGWAAATYLATSTPTGTNPSGMTRTVTSDLNLRAGTSLADRIILVMPLGSAVTLTGESANGFVSVLSNGTAGWAFAAYLA